VVYLFGLILVTDTAHHVFSKVPHMVGRCACTISRSLNFVLGFVEQADLDWCSAAQGLCFALCIGAAGQRPNACHLCCILTGVTYRLD